jgi:hypothetical protein
MIKARAAIPNKTVSAAQNIDIIALYQRQHEGKTNPQGRRLDLD